MAMTIICGTDLSERSRPAIAAAAAVASAMQTPLWVAHVVGESVALLDPAAREQLADAVRDRLRRETAPAPGGVAVHHAMLEGSPHDALLSFARDRGATLLVVSSKGHGDSARYRIGGTSERIALDALLPLLVVRDADPFERWARRDRALRVVVGVDSSASAASAVRWPRALAAAGPCDVVFAHVYDDPEARERYGVHGGPETTAELERLVERDVTALVGAFPGLGSHTLCVRAGTGRCADSLLDVVREERADLVVLGTHHRRGRHACGPSRAPCCTSRRVRRDHPDAGGGLGPALPGRIRTALVATDLTPESNAGVPFAFSLVDRGGKVHVVHVLPPRDRSEERERYDAVVADQLRRVLPAGLAERGISAQLEVAHGEVTSTICDLAERLGADIVCVTSRRHGLARVMGSVVSELLEASRKPVLVIHPPPA
jgi:nucleotide-binding universal stress UspA family protein